MSKHYRHKKASRRSRKRPLREELKWWAIIIGPLAFAGTLVALYYEHPDIFDRIVYPLIGIASAYVLYRGFRWWQTHHRYRQSSIEYHIEDALRIMKTTRFRFANEEEANRRLADILATKGFEVWSVPQIGNQGKHADLRVGDNIIEGKLNLQHSSDLDRLVGQLYHYCNRTPFKIDVVLYGHTDRRLLHELGDAARSYNGRVDVLCQNVGFRQHT